MLVRTGCPGALPFRLQGPHRKRPGWIASDGQDRKSTRLNSSHANISYAVFCLKKKNKIKNQVFQRSIFSVLQPKHIQQNAYEDMLNDFQHILVRGASVFRLLAAS